MVAISIRRSPARTSRRGVGASIGVPVTPPPNISVVLPGASVSASGGAINPQISQANPLLVGVGLTSSAGVIAATTGQSNDINLVGSQAAVGAGSFVPLVTKIIGGGSPLTSPAVILPSVNATALVGTMQAVQALATLIGIPVTARVGAFMPNLHSAVVTTATGTLLATTPGQPTAILLGGQAGPGFGVTLPASDANSFVGAITVTTNSGPFVGTVTLGGANAGSFSLSSSSNVTTANYPCNLYVGSSSIPAGSYVITLTATAVATVPTAIILAGQAGPNLGVTLPASDAGSAIGAITVNTNTGQTYAGTITIGGADASSFSLSPSSNVLSAAYPCSLYVGQSNIGAATYVITLTSNP